MNEQNNGRPYPDFVYKSVIVLVIAFLLLSLGAIAYFHHSSLDDFARWVLYAFFACLIVIALKLGLNEYHAFRTKHYQQQQVKHKAKNLDLKNQLLEKKVDAAEELRTLLQEANRLGRNITFEGAVISDWRSNLHNLNTVEADPLKQLTAGNISKPTIDEIVKEIEPNSLEIGLGRSLTTGQVPIESIDECHLKIIGGSRKGKSCGAASIIDELYRLDGKRMHAMSPEQVHLTLSCYMLT